MKNGLRTSMSLLLGAAALAVSAGAWAHGPDRHSRDYYGHGGHPRYAPVVVYQPRYYAPRRYYEPPVVRERVIVREVQPVVYPQPVIYYPPQPGFTIGINVPPIVVHVR